MLGRGGIAGGTWYLAAAGRQRGAAWGVSWLVISASRNSQQPPGEKGGIGCMEVEGEEGKNGIIGEPQDAVQLESLTL